MRTALTARLARTAATTLAVAVASLVAVGLAVPAQAGGPTSVLLVVPGGGGTASLYYDDPEYAELTRLVGADLGSAPGDNTSGAGHETGSAVTVTWLIHDVQVWRVDRIYLGGPGGPWVATQVGYDGDIWSSAVSWHQPTEPKVLLTLLDHLGLDPTDSDGGIPLTDTQQAPEASPVERAAAPAAQQDAPDRESGTPWLLLTVVGLGSALAAVAVVTLPLARRAPVGTDSVVNDEAVSETAGGDVHGADADWSPAEELVTRR